MKNKKQINCELNIIDINNNLIDSFYLCANVEIPKLCCLRYKNILKESHIPLIAIKAGFKENQKFRIPFKNLAIKDLKADFCLLSSIKNEDNINELIYYEIIFDGQNVIIPSHDVNYLEMIINVKSKKVLDIKDKSNYIKIKKIINAKIFGTKINYYFCLELIVVNENNENENVIENI